MVRQPNYSHERNERDRAKANKKAEKLAAKALAREREAAETKRETEPATQSDD